MTLLECLEFGFGAGLLLIVLVVCVLDWISAIQYFLGYRDQGDPDED